MPIWIEPVSIPVGICLLNICLYYLTTVEKFCIFKVSAAKCRGIDDEHQINTRAIAEKHNKFWPLQWNVLAAAKFV